MERYYQLKISRELSLQLERFCKDSTNKEACVMRDFVRAPPVEWTGESKCTDVRGIEYSFRCEFKGDMWLSSPDYRHVAVVEFKHMRWDEFPDTEDRQQQNPHPRKPGRRPTVQRNHKKNKAREQAKTAFAWLVDEYPDAELSTAWACWNEPDGSLCIECVDRREKDRKKPRARQQPENSSISAGQIAFGAAAAAAAVGFMAWYMSSGPAQPDPAAGQTTQKTLRESSASERTQMKAENKQNKWN
eukprot:TRINITY_DN1261_c0_g1_i2.p1 TRINITY_DN1261_c0_g1~~TRINITY_DN1261_c0_g1_i2.p1  ORF type:complete len:245 (+),score=28.95 TRINITY_DN1261_c0_g1_i2:163-897(+)